MLDLSQNPIVYVTRDIERALGLPIHTLGYYIISNYSEFANKNYKSQGNVLLIQEDSPLDTWQLLKHKTTIDFVSRLHTPHILLFKNTPQIERICQEQGWNFLNPSAEFANNVEEKISQVAWLGELTKYLPPHEIKLCRDVTWNEKPFILQFNRAHTGLGTFFINDEKKLNELQETFPNREARITDYIVGPMFTSNNVVTHTDILMGNINYQITGLKPFTKNPFATIGNDWGIVKELLNEKQIKTYKKITTDIGNKLRQDGWKGLFGVDIMLDEKTGELYLIEINARQPASTTYESILQQKTSDFSKQTSDTTFEAHTRALLGERVRDIIKIEDGAQIILRNQEGLRITSDELQDKLQKDGFAITPYSNTKPGSDLLRIQSKTSIMKKHNEFNENGQSILNNLAM
ncbi:MAG TPA: hypothetical protein DCS29_00480 [Candidatus Magasanikbacteria bacterium]|nr:MAG: hypothetical protein A2479_01135 [Candidatus Magasanikbacteria bacterium RIFOXYC2_FULL_39_8]HAT03241.1 hypothetical protein [Candidatus Magasanikbacteria bacterium]